MRRSGVTAPRILNFGIVEVCGQLRGSAALAPGKEPQVPIGYDAE
jgi:hypothetical protein